MLGFIKKDLLLIKGNLRMLLVVLVGFCIMLLNDITSITFILPFMCVMMCISTFSYDDYNKWDAYALTLPNGRKNIVKGKYVSTIIIIIISTIITAIVTIGINSFKGTLHINDMVDTLLGGLFGVIVVMSIMYPFLYKYGVEKGRNILFVGIFGIGFIGGLIIKMLGNNNVDLKNIIDFINNYGTIIFTLFTIILLSVSYYISEKIYLKKEF